MNKIYYWCVLFLLAGYWHTATAQAFSGGSGTAEDPYLISSLEDMEQLADIVKLNENFSRGKYFSLTQDIRGVTEVINSFQGVFNGNGHHISMNLDVYSGGLFLSVANADIKNLQVAGTIQGPDEFSSTTTTIGSICANAQSSTFSHCHSSVDILGAAATVGGLCGNAEVCQFDHCSNEGSIQAAHYDGGICGKAISCSIENCYNTGILSFTTARAGGICGEIESTEIYSCYNTGNLQGIGGNAQYHVGSICGATDLASRVEDCVAVNTIVYIPGTLGYAGRIVGYNKGTVDNCYARKDIMVYEGKADRAAPGIDMDASSFQDQQWIEENLHWDFNDTWYMPADGGYPLLKKLPNLRLSASVVDYGGSVTLLSDRTDATIACTASDPSMVTISGNTVTPTRTGTVTLYLSQPAVAEYVAGETPVILTVLPKTLVVRADNQSMTYGDIPPAYTCHYEGFVNGDTEAVLTALPVLRCEADAYSPAGEYAIVPSGVAANNYTFDYRPGVLTVGKRTLQVVPDNANREYGQENPEFVISYEGFVNEDGLFSLAEPPIAVTEATPESDAGDYAIICTGGDDRNYAFGYGTAVLSVTKAPLRIQPYNASRKQGEENPKFRLSYNGFRNDDDPSCLDELPTASCVANATSIPGLYEIVLTGGKDNNYEYNLQSGTLEVTAASGLPSTTASVSCTPTPCGMNCSSPG